MADLRSASVLAAMTVASLVQVSCGRHAQPQIHLIPAGYTGTVFIIHGVHDGRPPKYEGMLRRSRVYEIPSGGVLRSQLSADYGWHWAGEIKYFYVNPDGSRTPIEGQWYGTIHDTPANRSDALTGIMAKSNGTAWSLGSCEVDWSEYFVGTMSQILDEDTRASITSYLSAHPVACP